MTSRLRRFAIIVGLPAMLASCTVTGDILNPPREERARCPYSSATPISQSGLTPPIASDAFPGGKL